MSKVTPPDHLAELGSNLSAASSALDEDDTLVQKPAKAAVAKRVPAGERRVKIILEDNEQIPPGGQFVGVNGKGYMIQAGVEVSVPESILEVLDNAIESHPILDGARSVIGYRNRKRFPYQIVTERNTAGRRFEP